MHPNPRRIVPVILLLAIIGGAWWFLSARTAGENGALSASGTIEATEIAISAELGGRVIAVSVEEGQVVEAGEVLIQFDTALLDTQRAQAAARLAAARAGHAAAQAAQVTAQAGYEAAVANYELLRAGPSDEQLAVAQAGVDQARVAADVAQQAYDDLPEAAEETPDGKALKGQLDQALAALDGARAQYALIEAGARPEQLEAAQAQMDAARAQVEAAKAQVAAASAQARAAQAAVGLLDVQISKLTLTAPADGVVLSRAIQPGEVASPGASLLVIGRLEDLTITVYVPEDRYGTLSLGQAASVSVDSFPDTFFTAVVTHIADRAEFTPRNVQTAEGRKTTVFAIRLSIDNPDGKLKPGMPADVTFRG